MANLMPEDRIERSAAGVFSVMVDNRREIIYLAGPPSDRWAAWNGNVYRVSADTGTRSGQHVSPLGPAGHSLVAPMPATVIAVLVAPGARVAKGESLILLEAMKMELPIRALGDATVKAIHCRAGDLVQADQELVELE
ncbi:MAG: acetyl-CoA carboxylase biotin carboxyl carrier protein subunit [Acidobacteriota bacterium]